MTKQEIIAELESQYKAIGKALAALNGDVRTGKGKWSWSPAARARLAKSMKAAWAKRKAK